MKTLVPFALLCLMLAVGGCVHNCYEVEITPDGDGFQRELTCWKSGGSKDSGPQPLNEQEIAKIGRLYQGHETIDDGKKHKFSGRFTDQTPADVGGAGSYTRFVSPLGTLTGYVERFRGNDDLKAALTQRQAAADRLVDLLTGWLQAEIGQEPGFDRLKKFLDGPFRQDVKNMVVYAWTANAVSSYDADSGSEFLIRTGQYLCERGYLAPTDVPLLARAVTSNDPVPVLRHVQRLIARKMGIADDQPLPPSFGLLADPSRLEASWNRYVATTDLFQQRIKQWQKRKAPQLDADQPTPKDLTGELATEAFLGGGLFEARDSLEVKLHCPEKPTATNGKWDEKAATVQWSTTLEPARALPAVCFASWAVADEKTQQTHFGRVILTGESLANYIVWYRGLGEAETAEWDRFIDQCKPEGDLKERIEAFRFSSDPPPDPSKPDERPASLADTPRGLLLSGLEPAK